MKILFILTLITFSSFAKKPQPREHKAHSHGHASLSVAFDNLQGQIDFKSPAESIVGFEYIPKSEKDKTTLANVIQDFEQKIATFIQFDPALGCVISKTNVALVPEKDGGRHADFRGQFLVKCTQSIVNSKLVFDFTSYKKLKEVEVVVLAGDKQVKADVEGKKTTVEVK